MKTFLKYTLLGILVTGSSFALYVLGSALFGTGDNQAVSFVKDKKKPVMTKAWLQLEPAPATPKAVFIDSEGNEKTLQDFSGQVVLLNIWATWCEPCVREMPSLNALQEKWGSDRFTVLTINEDRAKEEAEAFLIDNHIDQLPLYRDNSFALVRDLYVEGYPSGLPISVLYSATGKEIARFYGEADWLAQAQTKWIERALPADKEVNKISADPKERANQ